MMNEVLHANIFFIIASVASVAFAIMVCIAMYYVIKILASVQAIVARVEEGSDVIAEDVAAMREFVKGGGFVSSLVSFVSGKPRSHKRARRAKDATED
jgi:hypothetical protein